MRRHTRARSTACGLIFTGEEQLRVTLQTQGP